VPRRPKTGSGERGDKRGGFCLQSVHDQGGDVGGFRLGKGIVERGQRGVVRLSHAVEHAPIGEPEPKAVPVHPSVLFLVEPQGVGGCKPKPPKFPNGIEPFVTY